MPIVSYVEYLISETHQDNPPSVPKYHNIKKKYAGQKKASTVAKTKTMR